MADVAKAPKSEQEDSARIIALIEEASKKAPVSVQPYIKKAAPAAAFCFVMFQKALPYLVQAYEMGTKLYQQIPTDLLSAIFGLMICFFGGMYPTTIAAGEAFMLTGGSTTFEALETLGKEVKKLNAANKKDDGVPDVKQISTQQYIQHKTHLALITVNPQLISNALGGLYTGWIGVIATLKVQFAKTVALGVSIGNVLKKPAHDYVEPTLRVITPKEYAPWIPVVLDYICKAIAVSIAWTLQRIISAFHSAIRGGLMFSRNVMTWAAKQGYIAEINHEESYLDEVVGWGCAAMGFIFQLKLGFALPWLLRLCFFPVEILEYYLMWTITE